MPLPVFLAALAEAFATASASTLPAYLSKNSRFLSPNLLQIERAGTTGGGTVWGAKLNGLSNANRQDFQTDGVATNYDTSIPFVALANNNWIVRTDRSPRSGTAAVTAGSATVTGTSTAFLTELRPGQEITINGERKVITAIASATSLTVDTAYVATATTQVVNLMDDILMPTTDFTVSNQGGFARITLTAAAKGPANTRMQVHFVTPASLFTYATATTTFAKREIPSGYDVMWYVTDATASPSATNLYVSDIGD